MAIKIRWMTTCIWTRLQISKMLMNVIMDILQTLTMGLKIFAVMMGLEIFVTTTVFEIHAIMTHLLDMMMTVHLLHLPIPPSLTSILRNSFVMHIYQKYGMACTL
ncbi:hypothetical protein BKA82DRAFT_4013014 [Pisolithus tinctorius]|nr:hypothetical protein BKA82DRAFT_4013014 [Pisolithus tinctorius]